MLPYYLLLFIYHIDLVVTGQRWSKTTEASTWSRINESIDGNLGRKMEQSSENDSSKFFAYSYSFLFLKFVFFSIVLFLLFFFYCSFSIVRFLNKTKKNFYYKKIFWKYFLTTVSIILKRIVQNFSNFSIDRISKYFFF